jgi:hypothetical protein
MNSGSHKNEETSVQRVWQSRVQRVFSFDRMKRIWFVWKTRIEVATTWAFSHRTRKKKGAFSRWITAPRVVEFWGKAIYGSYTGSFDIAGPS